MLVPLRHGVHECGVRRICPKAVALVSFALATSIAQGRVVDFSGLDDAQHADVAADPREEVSLQLVTQSGNLHQHVSLGPQLSTVTRASRTAPGDVPVTIPLQKVMMSSSAGRFGLGPQLRTEVRPFRRVAPTPGSTLRQVRQDSETYMSAAILGPQMSLQVQAQHEQNTNSARTEEMPLFSSSKKASGTARLGLGPQISSRVGPRRTPASGVDASSSAQESKSIGLVARVWGAWNQSGTFHFFMLCLVVNALALIFLNSKFSSPCRPLSRHKNRLLGMHASDKKAAFAAHRPDLSSSSMEV
mmetsp:Transcript_112245/g.281257  ORF Transcript_112245/g.281257 Transcript_112245/m.281257 type:complete len:302 (+) Transcript_112245:77-982(+)